MKLLGYYAMLLFLVIIWGFGWPVAKIALQDIPPLWLGTSRFVIATVFAFIGIIVFKQFKWPTRKDLPVLCSVSLLQMTLFIVFTSTGLWFIDAARSSILVYTIPLWSTPIAVLFYKEQLSSLKIYGLILGLIGVLLLFNPLDFDWHNWNTVMGNSFLLLGAISIAISLVHVRYLKWHLTPLQLLPWQLLIATICLFIFAVVFEPHPVIHWTSSVVHCILYIALLPTLLGYWMVIEVGRKFSSVTTSLSLLGVPVIGVMSSHFLLHQTIPMLDIISLIAIIAGITLVIIQSASAQKL